MSEIQWQYIFDPALAFDSVGYILKGLGYTLGISLPSMIFGTLLGFLLAIMRMSNSKVL